MTCHMNISIGCIILAQKRQISHSMKKPAYYFLIVLLACTIVQYSSDWFIENRCTASKKFHPTDKKKILLLRKNSSKAPLSIQRARGLESHKHTHKKCLRK